MPVEASTSGSTLVVTSIPVTMPPMVAVVAPTTRATSSTMTNGQPHINNSSSPIKVSANAGAMLHQQPRGARPNRMSAAAPATQHVSHVFHQFALPIQIPGNLAATQATGWPMAATTTEPVFHFGPGFEPRQVCPTHNPTNTSQSNSPEHVVFFHVSPGVSVTFQVAGNREVVRGPVTVPMVSQSGSPPIPMPVQVPPGHVMQQIVDENGTLRHVILSTAPNQQISGQPGQPHMHAPYLSNGSGPYFNPGIAAGYPSSGPHFHHISGGHLQPQPPMSHSPHSPSPPNNNFNAKDERTQRQHQKLVRKLKNQQTREMNSTMSTPTHSPSPRKNELNGVSNLRRHQRSNGTSSVGTSEDGEESSSVPDEEDDAQAIIDQLSNIQSPTVAELSARAALLQWTMPPSSENVQLNFSDLEFEILLADRGKDGRYKQLFKGRSLSCRIQDLSPGKEYACILQVYSNQHCTASEPVLFTTPKCEPNAPADIKCHTRTKNSLQLKWNAPIDNGAPILQYVLECDIGKNGEFVEVCRTRSKTYHYTKLMPATAYMFRLAAVNEVGRSAYSPIAKFETAANPPMQPAPPYLQNATSSSLLIGWNRRPSDDDFVLQMVDPSTQGYFNMYDGPETSYECTGLRRATPFQLRLRARNEAGVSSWSEEVVFRTLPECPGRPNKPQVKGKIHATNFRVRWEPPADRGGADIKTYYLEISSGARFDQVYCGSETETVCDRLSPGTTYQLRVICEGPAGSSGYSDYLTVTTEPVVPGPPPTPELANQPGPFAAVLRWEKPDYNGGAPVTQYEMDVEGGTPRRREQAYLGKEQYCVVKDLLPGETYTVQVRALNRIGAGPWSDEFTFKTGAAPPQTPLAPTVAIKSPSQLIVSWNEPCTNGAAITEYRLEYSQTESYDGFSVAYQGAQTTSEVKNLTPATLYYFRVSASNHAGTSPYSPMTKQQTPAAPPGAPVWSAHEKSACDIRLTWHAPESYGVPIQHYNIECDNRVLSTPDAALEYVVEGLNSETTYKMRIQAVNRIGTGAFSNYLKVTTLAMPPRAPRLECNQVGYNFIKLRWAEERVGKGSSSGSSLDIVRYHVEMQNYRTKEYQNVYSGTRNTCKITKLHEMQAYTFRIYAEADSTGPGDYSDEFTFSTPAALPNSIKPPRIALDQQQSQVTTDHHHHTHTAAVATHVSGFATAATVQDGQQQHDDPATSSSLLSDGAHLTIEWQQSKTNAFTDRVEYQLQMAKGTRNDQEFKEVYRGPETRFTFTCLEYETEYSFRVCPIRVSSSTGDDIPGAMSAIMVHTIARPEDNVDATDGATDAAHSHAGGSSSSSASSHGQARRKDSGGVAGSNETVVNKLFDSLSFYRNRDKFTDEQKAMIYVVVFMIAAPLCAAIVDMLLR